MGRDKTIDRANVINGVPSRGAEGEDVKIASPGMGGHMVGGHLPHSGTMMHSSVGKELSADKYAKRKGSDESEKTAV